MVKRPCPTYYKGVPGPIMRWIDHKICGGPRLLKCEDCGNFHIKSSPAARTETQSGHPEEIRSVQLNQQDDTLTRARKCLRFAGFSDPDRHQIAVHVAFMMEQYRSLDRAAQEDGDGAPPAQKL